MKILENERIKLRAIEPEDLDLLFVWENDTAFWTAGNTRVPYSRFQLKQYVANPSYDIYENGNLRLMIEDKVSGKTVGTVDLFDFDMHHSRIALGLFVTDESRGKGFAKQALHLTEQYIFDFLKINQLYVQIAESNSASRHLFDNYFELHGMLKDWVKTEEGFENILTYQRFLSSYSKKNV